MAFYFKKAILKIMDFKKLKENILLFFSLERYAFLILGILVICSFLEILNVKYIKYPYSLIYTTPYILTSIYSFIKMLLLFIQWPRKKRFHKISVSHFKRLKDEGRYISRARLSAMNTPCEKITRNTIYKTLEEN